MYAHSFPTRLIRALSAPRLAAGVVVTLALLTAACSDAASRISAPPLNSASAVAFAKTSAITAPFLGTAATFAALGGAGVTCTVPNPPLRAVTTISGGDVGSGLVGNSSVTGFPGFTPGDNRCSLSGRVRLNATAAITDLTTAYNFLRDNNTCPSTIASHNLGALLTSQGSTLGPGVYCISDVVLLTSPLTLSGGPSDIWIFKSMTPTTSLTPNGGSVVMAGGGQACNVYWQISTAVNLLNTAFVGNVLAGTAISFTGAAPPATGSSLVGRALAISESVTMTGANIVACTAGNGNGKGDDDGDKDHHDKDKDHDKGDKGDKDHGGDHGDGRGGHDGGDHGEGRDGHNS